MDIADGTQTLDPEWFEVTNNVCDMLHDCGDTSSVAEHFVRAGWGSRSSSWDGYEVETSWCQVELDLIEGSGILLNGVADPQRFEELAGILHRFSLRYSLELYDEDGALVREIRARAAEPAAKSWTCPGASPRGG
ncbi:hypothetical protein ACPCSC_12195 [Streptomyces lavendulocolor]|uniref:hypothetical protein n=1 Tax=Streptomyces lavendulocolor TaxID=67316 RepID=UPI003C309247